MLKKAAFFFRKMQTLPENNSGIFRIKNAKFIGYDFYLNFNKREIFKSALAYLKKQ